MARKVKHDQRSVPDLGWRCSFCAENRCLYCLDVSRITYGFGEPLCQCERQDHSRVIELARKASEDHTHHSVEPRDRQILDPETGTVHAPGLTVSIEGEVRHG